MFIVRRANTEIDTETLKKKTENKIKIYHESWQNSITQARCALFSAGNDVQKDEKGWYICYKDDELEIKRDIAIDQTHRDILDLILLFGEKKILRVEDGWNILTVLVPIKAIRDIKKVNHVWVIEKIEELKYVNVEANILKDQKHLGTVSFNIISSFVTTAAKGQYKIEFDRKYTRLFVEHDIPINYSSILTNIVNIKDQKIKAVIRYCLSQKEFVNQSLFDILRTLGYNAEEKSDRVQRKIKKVFADNSDLLKKFNILYDRKRNTIKYSRIKNIYHFTNSQATLKAGIQSIISPEKQL